MRLNLWSYRGIQQIRKSYRWMRIYKSRQIAAKTSFFNRNPFKALNANCISYLSKDSFWYIIYMFISTLSSTMSKICTLLYFHMVGKEIMISVLHLSLSGNHIKRFTSQKSSTLTFDPATVWQSLNGQTHKNESHLSDKNSIRHCAFPQGNICQEPSCSIDSQSVLSIANLFYR